MKTSTSINKIPFEKLVHLFIKRSENKFVLDPLVGKGYVQIFDLEKGLQARFWDCIFKEGIEMYSDADSEIDNAYFTLAFFLNMQGLQFAHRDTILRDNIIWDSIFISATSNYKMHIGPKATVHCLSISFSKRWLNNNLLQDNEAFKNLKEKIDTTESFSLLQSMTSADKKSVQELFDASWKRSLGSFYIKSAVLKIVCDFFYTLKQSETFSTNNPCIDISIAEVEKYLSYHLTAPLPNLKDLAHKFSLSESTLKRHFKKKYGVNMSTFFTRKKMEYAQQLIDEKNTSVSETAHLVGYRNVNNFIAMFEKYAKLQSI